VNALDPDRLAELRTAKLRALVAGRWEPTERAVAAAFPAGATLVDPGSSAAWVLVEEDAERRVGAALAVAVRAGVDHLHLLCTDEAAAPVVARRGDLVVGIAVTTWVVDGTGLRQASAAAPPTVAAPAPEAELFRPLLVDAGLAPVVEQGELCGELLGLEAARVVVDAEGSAQVEAGVGRFDREAGAMMRAGMSPAEALRVVVDLVAPLRRPGAERHPMNQLVRERWLRTVLVGHPDLVGARELTAVESAVPRRNLTEDGVASAVGLDLDGRPLVVTCTTGVNLDAPVAAADDRLMHRPDARLLLVTPEGDRARILVDLVAHLRDAEVVTVADTWPERSPGRS